MATQLSDFTSNLTTGITMETLIMYFLMWEAEIDMEEWSEAVTHASEYQHLSHAVNNDSTVALCLLVKPPWSLGESCQGNGELNKSTVACQEGWLAGVERQKTRSLQSKYTELLLSVCCVEWSCVDEGANEASLQYDIFTSTLALKRRIQQFSFRVVRNFIFEW